MFLIKTRVAASPIHGNGVFSCEHVLAGAVIWPFHPPFDQILSEDDVTALSDVAREYLKTYAYQSLDLGGRLVLCADHARFLNHSDDPNTEERPFASIARRTIAVGDEITCDYRAFCAEGTDF